MRCVGRGERLAASCSGNKEMSSGQKGCWRAVGIVSRRRGCGSDCGRSPASGRVRRLCRGPGRAAAAGSTLGLSTDLEAKERAGSPAAGCRPYWSTSWCGTGVCPRQGLQKGLPVTLRARGQMERAPSGWTGWFSVTGIVRCPCPPLRLRGLPQGRRGSSSPPPAGTQQEQIKLSPKPLSIWN